MLPCVADSEVAAVSSLLYYKLSHSARPSSQSEITSQTDGNKSQKWSFETFHVYKENKITPALSITSLSSVWISGIQPWAFWPPHEVRRYGWSAFCFDCIAYGMPWGEDARLPSKQCTCGSKEETPDTPDCLQLYWACNSLLLPGHYFSPVTSIRFCSTTFSSSNVKGCSGSWILLIISSGAVKDIYI